MAEESKTYGITYIPSKAGYSWGYLQFQNIGEKVLFLIKNSFAMKRKNLLPIGNKEENYIEKLAKINKNVQFPMVSKSKSDQLELRLFDNVQVIADSMQEEAVQLERQFDRFYIITYTLDENKMISDINLCLPHPETTELYQVDSWNRFFDKLDIEFHEEDFFGIKDDKEMETQVSIGDYGIVIDNTEKASDTKS